MRTILFTLLIGASLSSLSQVSGAIFFVDSSSSPIRDVIVLEWNGATWLSDLDGKAILPEDHLDSLVLHSMTFQDTVVNVVVGDTIKLIEQSSFLSEVVVYDRSDIEYVDHRRARYEFQREPGDYYLLGFYSEEEVILDSLTVHVQEVVRNTARIRVIVWKDDSFLYESQLYSIPDDLRDEKFTVPINFYEPLNREVYIGIQFLEVGHDPFNASAHHFQFKGRGNVYTNSNTGITLGSIRLKGSERMMIASYFGGKLRIEYLECEEFRHRSPYLGVHYHGSGELLTDFDDIEN